MNQTECNISSSRKMTENLVEDGKSIVDRLENVLYRLSTAMDRIGGCVPKDIDKLSERNSPNNFVTAMRDVQGQAHSMINAIDVELGRLEEFT